MHSTTLPPLLKAPSKELGPCGSGVNRRGWRARQGAKGENPLPVSPLPLCFSPRNQQPAPFPGLPPSLALPHIRLRPKAGFGETSAGEGTHLYRGASPSRHYALKKGWDRQTR
ncbi:hypothetical protein C7G41_28245 [Bradyrhizobium sp. MOS002]|nr:hypothetical protein C7G41_28245 [Bradyrhizobium sp. MOS002]